MIDQFDYISLCDWSVKVVSLINFWTQRCHVMNPCGVLNSSAQPQAVQNLDFCSGKDQVWFRMEPDNLDHQS